MVRVWEGVETRLETLGKEKGEGEGGRRRGKEKEEGVSGLAWGGGGIGEREGEMGKGRLKGGWELSRILEIGVQRGCFGRIWGLWGGFGQ